MVFPLLENWMGGSSRHHFPDAVGALGWEPERNVVGPHYNTPESIAAARARQASSIRA